MKIMKRVRYCRIEWVAYQRSYVTFIVIRVYQVACLHSKHITKLMTD